MKRNYSWFIGLVILLLLLSSCHAESNIAKPSKPSPSLNIVAELPSELIATSNDPFEIRIGYGQAAKWYNYATLEINATDFEITDSQGNVYKDKYICTISDFSDERFFIADTTNFTDTCYYDTFKFKYIGEKPEASGGISVWLTTLQHGEPSTPAEQNQGPEGVLVEFFYKIKNQQIILSTEK
jgi:hypothetical protein